MIWPNNPILNYFQTLHLPQDLLTSSSQVYSYYIIYMIYIIYHIAYFQASIIIYVTYSSS